MRGRNGGQSNSRSPNEHSKEQMKVVFDDIRNALLHAQHCCDFWWLLEGAHLQRTAVIGAFEELPVVYETLRPALYTSFIIKVCSVFGTGSNDITLRSLPDAELDTDFSRIWEIGRRLYQLRSKLIAHLDSRCDPDLVAKETGLTNDSLRVFLADTVTLYNRIAERNREPYVADFGIGDEIMVFLVRLNQRNEEPGRTSRGAPIGISTSNSFQDRFNGAGGRTSNVRKE